ncbi:methyl-accepting chemotaxis protein Mcp [Gottschalkia acidurici 9a]|uniref:Methyl-accepting chemotaxis protein Mcp n=1 Tax=Gottschalkia acidurici (strain ATCC 7906 / DSM 604 / BCRC 14475 / CIP 104303 / KCTC 5404 / NCIMB 10678 / 9a) TaxID=1128398 RepID=K0B457_GOTA9|nr:methyl-accepting chemotaxis protein [Gottschalkia acidurici]AFS79725.1 methyl-accepting chemotaxis protein Mcp [Gottschalkia acidurici 9a]
MLKTIKSKLIILISALILSLIFVGIFSTVNLKQVSNQSFVISEQWIPGITLSEELNTMTSDLRILDYRYIIETDVDKMNELHEDADQRSLKIENALSSYEKSLYNDKDKKIYEVVKSEWNRYIELHKRIMDLSMEGRNDEAMVIMTGEAKDAFDSASNSLIELANFNKEMAETASKEADNTYKAASAVSIIIVVILTIVGSVFAGVIILGIIKSLNILKKEITALAERGGDLTQEIKVDSKDEIADLANAFNSFLSNLRVIIKSIKDNNEITIEINEAINTSLSQLTEGVEEVSATTQEISAGMEETAASAEEMAATSKEIERAAESIAKRSQEGAISASEISSRAAETKVRVVEAQSKASEILVQTESELDEALKNVKVVEQIEVLSEAIMDITAQTNLLALNAAIEAARAGEAGKGFSVVAEEIRKLAHQSEESVVQIQSVTEKVMESVKGLTNSSNRLLLFMTENVSNDYKMILEVVEKYSEDSDFVDNLVTEFSSTSEELLASVQNVLQAIEQVAESANEGAHGTTNIAEKMVYVNDKAHEVDDKTNESTEFENVLREHIGKFTV